MKAVILAGGRGTRLSEETLIKPKPLVEAGGEPLIWHIMQNYYLAGISEFIVLSGYKGRMITEYFANFSLHTNSFSIDLTNPSAQVSIAPKYPWKITVLDTGLETQTAGRIKMAEHLLDDQFLLTYGDGVSDVQINNLIDFHNKSKCLVTLTAVQPPARFGAISIDPQGMVAKFEEKSIGEGGWVNGGFFVVEKSVLDLIESENQSFEIDILSSLSEKKKVAAYKHEGYWQAVDTVRDLYKLEKELSLGRLPWL